MSEQLVEREQRVTPVELFFDLVFVFAFTQVTTVLRMIPFIAHYIERHPEYEQLVASGYRDR